MTEFLLNIPLDYVRCEEHDEVANFICLEKQCERKGLSCPICEPLFHKDHAFKPLKFFLSELVQPQSRFNSLTLISAAIDLIVTQIQSEFKKIASAEERNQMEKAFSNYMNQLHEKIDHEFSIQKELRQFFEASEHLTAKQINQFINKFQLHEYQPEIPPQKPFTNQEKYLYQMHQMLKDKKQDLLSLVKAKTDVKDILGLFMFSEVKEKLSFTFSEEFHHTSIKILEKLTAKQEHNYSSNFALIQPLVMGKKKTMEKKSVKIKIDKLNSWVNLGICVKSKAISSNYYLNTEDIGHGGYTISNDGYSWHNTDSSANSHYHGWSFAQGDIITMTYDPKTKTIKYTKENSEKDYELNCDPIPGEEMYFCCTLNTHDETVSIVQ